MKRMFEIVGIYLPALLLILSISWVLAYRWLPVRWTPLMLIRTIENADLPGYSNRQIWTSKENIDPILIDAILLTEDQRFYSHNGFDIVELRKMKEDGKKSVGLKAVEEGYRIIEIPSKKLRVFMDSDFSIMKTLEEGD